MSKPLAVLYAVQNEKGQWFRRKGYGGYGDTWIDNFASARIYQRIGAARGVISFFANHYAGFPTPKLVELRVTAIVEIDETDRVNKQKQKKQLAAAKREERNRKRELEHATQQLADAQARVERLRS